MESVTRQTTVTTTLTVKDIRLLHLLSQCGVIKPDQAKIAYGDVRKYHLRRIEKLVAAGIIARTHGYVRATTAGLRMAGINDEPLRIDRHRYQEHSIIVDIASRFPGWIATYPRELKSKNIVERKSRLSMTLSRDDTKYAVYLFTNAPDKATLHAFLSEIGGLPAHQISKIVVFCTSSEIMQVIAAAKIKKVSECCLLPYPDGIASFKRYLSQEFREYVQTRFPGAVKSGHPSAHFEWRSRTLITVMIHNDLVKRAALVSYVKSAQKTSGRPCIAICSPSQEFDIPGVEIIYDQPQAAGLQIT
jgi:DNA-binding Lrp family transcriptional regulator